MTVVIAAGRPDWRRRDAPKAPRVGTTRSHLVPCAWPSSQLWWSPTPRC